MNLRAEAHTAMPHVTKQEHAGFSPRLILVCLQMYIDINFMLKVSGSGEVSKTCQTRRQAVLVYIKLKALYKLSALYR